MKRYKIKRKQADGSFVELSLDTSIDSVYRVKDGNIKTLTDILTEEYAPKDNPVFTGSISLGRKEGTTVGEGSFAVGKNLEASGSYSHAEGNGSTVSGECAHAEGYYNTSSGYCSHAEGYANDATRDYSHAEGYHTTASSTSSHAEGYYTTASGPYSHAEGFHTEASGEYSHVQGKFNIEDTENKYAHIVGNGTINTKSNAHTLDWNGNAWYAGDVQANNVPHIASEKVVLTIPAASISAKKTEIDNATDEGRTISIKVDTTIVYDLTKSYYVKYNNTEYHALYLNGALGAAGNDCECLIAPSKDKNNTELVIFSLDTTNITDMQLIERDIKKLDDKYLPDDLRVNNSITLGLRKGKIGLFSSSFGSNCEASGDFSHAEGTLTTASGEASHAEGEATIASGRQSHVEGTNNTASGEVSHAEGDCTIASGMCTHAEGGATTASGHCSHAEGFKTKASGDYQHVQGQFNIEDTANKYAHIVGNGKYDDQRSNAHTLDWKGNGWYAGKLSQDGTPTVDNDLTTKKYVDNKDITTRKYVDDKVAGIVNSAPETLDTLKELSTALGDDPNFATTVATNIGSKLNKPATEGTEGQVLSKAADGSNVWVDNGIDEDELNTMLTKTFGFVGSTAK